MGPLAFSDGHGPWAGSTFRVLNECTAESLRRSYTAFSFRLAIRMCMLLFALEMITLMTLALLSVCG